MLLGGQKEKSCRNSLNVHSIMTTRQAPHEGRAKRFLFLWFLVFWFPGFMWKCLELPEISRHIPKNSELKRNVQKLKLSHQINHVDVWSFLCFQYSTTVNWLSLPHLASLIHVRVVPVSYLSSNGCTVVELHFFKIFFYFIYSKIELHLTWSSSFLSSPFSSWY